MEEEYRPSTRLTDRRKNVFSRPIEKKKSTLYCNICNVPDLLAYCKDCKQNVCQICLKQINICHICYNLKKNSSKKVHPLGSDNNVKNNMWCCFF